jgi:uncharacterized membrane protein YeaQ/YmgE (transglycosylase-associated protein family)
MTLPSLILGFLISTLLGAFLHLILGGGLGRLVLYLFLGWIGFWVGQAVASQFGWSFDRLGQIHLMTASILCVLFILLGHYFSLIQRERK